MVAIVTLEDDHGVVASGTPEPVNVIADPTHTADTLPIAGKAFTAIEAVCWQPLLFLYVTIAEPEETPVTTPVVLTVAMVVFEDDQGVVASGVAVPVSVIVDPAHTADTFPITGSAFTVTEAVC